MMLVDNAIKYALHVLCKNRDRVHRGCRDSCFYHCILMTSTTCGTMINCMHRSGEESTLINSEGDDSSDETYRDGGRGSPIEGFDGSQKDELGLLIAERSVVFFPDQNLLPRQ